MRASLGDRRRQSADTATGNTDHDARQQLADTGLLGGLCGRDSCVGCQGDGKGQGEDWRVVQVGRHGQSFRGTSLPETCLLKYYYSHSSLGATAITRRRPLLLPLNGRQTPRRHRRHIGSWESADTGLMAGDGG